MKPDEQHAFDAKMAEALGSLPVPGDLRLRILATARSQPVKRFPRVLPWAMAASIVLGGSLVALRQAFRPPALQEFRVAMIEQAWDSTPHVEFTSSDLVEARRWLKEHHTPADFTVPVAAQHMRLRGCRSLEWRGQKVSLLCLLGESRHLHLFVIDSEALAGHFEENSPEFEAANGWKTVAWTTGGKTYLLSGINYLSFIKKSRKAGQWHLAG